LGAHPEFSPSWFHLTEVCAQRGSIGLALRFILDHLHPAQAKTRAAKYTHSRQGHHHQKQSRDPVS
jgi:hypothetical protein